MVTATVINSSLIEQRNITEHLIFIWCQRREGDGTGGRLGDSRVRGLMEGLADADAICTGQLLVELIWGASFFFTVLSIYDEFAINRHISGAYFYTFNWNLSQKILYNNLVQTTSKTSLITTYPTQDSTPNVDSKAEGSKS